MNKKDIYTTVKQQIQKHEGKEMDIEINNLIINKSGFNNDIAIFNLIYSKDGQKISKNVVLKDFLASDNTHQKNNKYEKEIAVMKNLAIIQSINVPGVHFEDEESKVVIMEKIEGVTLDKYCLAHPDQQYLIFKKFGETLGQIHSIDIHTVQDCFNDHDLWQKDDLNSYIENLKNRVAQFAEPEYLNILERIAEKLQAVPLNGALNHGDYHFWNVIITKEEKLFVLDWEKARIRDYRYDLANTLILGYSWFGMNFRKPMLEAYQKAANKELEHLDCFEALLSFDSFTKMVPLILGADDSHIRERSFEWLKRRYELFVRYNGRRIKAAEDYLSSKGLLLHMP